MSTTQPRGSFKRGRGSRKPNPAGRAPQMSYLTTAATADSTPFASGTATPAVPADDPTLEGKVRFKDFAGLDRALLDAIPFEFCTDVQAATLPTILEGHDLLAQAKTGTGKTVAFLVPTIQRLLSSTPPPASHTSILVLSPTRELALQIGVAAEGLLSGSGKGFGVKCVVGGTNIERDIKDLKAKRADILIATPGRLLDLIDNAEIGARFAGLQALVLDEADRLLDQGFRKELVKIIDSLPQKSTRPRQTLLFSATIPAEVHTIASLALDKNHKFISTLSEEDVNVHEHVIQESLVVPDNQVLIGGAEAIFREQSLTAERGGFKVMAFLPTARAAAIMADIFNALPADIAIPTWEIHSRMSQSARIKAIDQFRAAPRGVIFSSDVMARGIDVKGVTGVVQIGLPASVEQYVHRLGRTARAGSKGHGVLVLGQFESHFLQNNTLQTFNIQPYVSDAAARAFASSHITAALDLVTEESKAQAYQAWLGYYKTSTKAFRWSLDDLVNAANTYARDVLRYPGEKPPPLQAKTVGKMGLKGIKGLNVLKGEAGIPGGRGGGGGGRGGGGGGGGGQAKSGQGKRVGGFNNGQGQGQAAFAAENGGASSSGSGGVQRYKRKRGGTAGGGRGGPSGSGTAQ